jgi:hypothetical protein
MRQRPLSNEESLESSRRCNVVTPRMLTHDIFFIWVDVSDFETFTGIDTELIAKARPPQIPDGIDTVWIAQFDGTDHPVLWRCDRGARWVSAQPQATQP